MDIQNCLNHSILISSLAPMAAVLIFFKRHSSPNHTCMSGYTEHVGRHGANMGIETF